MNKGKLQLELALDLDEIFISEEYGTTLKQELLEIVKQEIREQTRKLARRHMKDFVQDFLAGNVQVKKDEEGNDCVFVPLLLKDFK